MALACNSSGSGSSASSASLEEGGAASKDGLCQDNADCDDGDFCNGEEASLQLLDVQRSATSFGNPHRDNV